MAMAMQETSLIYIRLVDTIKESVGNGDEVRQRS